MGSGRDGVSKKEGAASRRRGPYAKGQKRKDEILQAATTVFSRFGFNNASVVAIAEEAGITVAGLMHHFKTKEKLLVEILESRDKSAVAAHNVEDGDWQDVLRSYSRMLAENLHDQDIVTAFAILSGESLGANHPAAEWFEGRTRKVLHLIAASLARGIDAGTMKADRPPMFIASEIMAMMDGLQLQWLRFKGSTDITSVFDLYIERLIVDLIAKAPDGSGREHPKP